MNDDCDIASNILENIGEYPQLDKKTNIIKIFIKFFFTIKLKY